MKIYKVLTFFLLVVFLFTSCAQKVKIKALEPAEVDRISETKKIAVLNFKNDRVGLSRKIETQLSGFQIDNKKYFTIVSRTDIDTIIEEQKLQSSGLTGEDNSVKVGEIIGVQAIISGDVRGPTRQDSYFYRQRVRCVDNNCSKLKYYNVDCTKRVVGLAAEMRVVDVSRGDIIFADRLSKNRVFEHCDDDSRTLPSVSIVAQNMANALTEEFTYKLTPHYREFYVALLEDPDLDYTSEQENLLKFALEYIEQARYDKAEQLLTHLVDSTGGKSYVAFYNLGVIREVAGKYEEAKEYYEYADNLMVESVKEISEAIVRINTLIAKREKTLEQLRK